MENQVVGVRLEPKVIDFLKHQAYKMSVDLNKTVSHIDLIRDAISDKFQKNIQEYQEYLISDEITAIRTQIDVEAVKDIISFGGRGINHFIKLLNSDEGRVQIGQKIAEAFEYGLKNYSASRKFMNVDPLNSGSLARYECPSKAFYIDKPRGSDFVVSVKSDEEVLVTTFELAWEISHVVIYETKDLDRFIDNIVTKISYAIANEERLFFKLLKESGVLVVPCSNSTTANEMLKNTFELSKENHDSSYYNAVLHPNTAKKILPSFVPNIVLPESERSFHFSETFYPQYIYNILNSCPEDYIFILPADDYFSALPIRQAITGLPCNNPNNPELGWVVYEDIGMCVITTGDLGYSHVCCKLLNKKTKTDKP